MFAPDAREAASVYWFHWQCSVTAEDARPNGNKMAPGKKSISRRRTAARSSPPPRRRLTPEAREKLIVAEAIRYFAEFGFAASTRGLARRAGITQPLLYRYFPTKDQLIQRLFDELVVDRWRPEWEVLIADRAIPLVERLTDFYIAYTDSLFRYERMRVFFFMWLAGDRLRERFLTTPNRSLFRLIATEVRHEHGMPSPDAMPITAAEEEIVWNLQGGIMYLGIREFIFGLAPTEDRETLVRWQIETFARGIGPLLRSVLGANIVPDRVPAPAQPRRIVGG